MFPCPSTPPLIFMLIIPWYFWWCFVKHQLPIKRITQSYFCLKNEEMSAVGFSLTSTFLWFWILLSLCNKNDALSTFKALFEWQSYLILSKYLLTNSVVSFELDKYASICIACVVFLLLGVFLQCRTGQCSNADVILSPDGFLCPESSWLEVDVALPPGCRVSEDASEHVGWVMTWA